MSIAQRVAGLDGPWQAILAGLRAYLDACTDPAVGRITLVEAPAVLG
jgi:hypothetical protein